MLRRIKYIFKSIGIIIILTIINMIFLVCAFMLPTGKMRQHVADSYLLIEAEEPYLEWDTIYNSSRLDFWSEYTEYGMAINEDSPGSPFEQAMFMRFIDTEGKPRDVSVEEYAKNPDAYFELGEYPRYWNGIVIFYKLLLLFFTIPDIRMLNMFLQICLLCYIVYLMVKKDLSNYIFYFLMAVLLINPVTMLMSVKYSSEYIPMLIAIIIVLLFGEYIDEKEFGWRCFFSIVGATTSFLCMLSFPSITLGIPLLVMIWKTKERSVVRKVLSSSFYWFLGYSITWGMKWIICTIFTSYNLIEDALKRADYYSVEQEDTVSFLDRVVRNIEIYNLPAYKLLAVIMIIFIVISVIREIGKNNLSNYHSVFWDSILGYIFIMCIPLGIFYIFGNGYSYEHSYMAHRQLAISIVAGLCIIKMLVVQCICYIKK